MAKQSKFAELLAVQVAGGSSIKDGAKTIGCSESAAYHLSIDPSFRDTVARLRSEAIAQAVGRLSLAASLAVDALVKLLSSDEPKDRLNAAKAILASLAPLSEFGELRQRITDLERNQLRIAR